MKTLHVLFIIFAIIIFLDFELQPTYADNVNGIYVQNIMVQPYTIKVGDTFTVTATLVNNSTIPIGMEGGTCVPVSPTVPFFTILFDNHTKVKENNVYCADVGLGKILNPGENITGTSPDSTLSYIAIDSGTANATVTFSYHVINQTNSTQTSIQHTISKSFSFLINDNKTSVDTIGMKNSSKIGPAWILGIPSPLKQFNSGVKAQYVKCQPNYYPILIIKLEDGSPACVKSDTAQKLIKREWTEEILAKPTQMTNSAITNPLGVTALVTYTAPDSCLGFSCPPYTFYLKLNSNSTAYLLGYDICGNDLCVKNNTMSALLPINSMKNPNYTSIGLSDNKKWNYGDTANIRLEISPIQNNKNAYFLNIRNSTIVP